MIRDVALPDSYAGSGRFGGVRLRLHPHYGKGYAKHYNNIRLNSAIDYITPDVLAGQQEIQADRDRKLEAAKEPGKNRRQRAG